MYVTDKAKNDAQESPWTKRITLKFTVVIEPEDDGSFHAFCPAFPGLHVDGASEQEALRNAGNAAIVYVKSVVSNGEPLPLGPDCKVLEEEQIPVVPPGAFLRYLELQWPSLSMSGIS